MIFSELNAITKETGLSFDGENAILSGIKNNVPVAVFDNSAQHRFDIICGAMLTDSIIPRVTLLTESFPKKTVLGIENTDGCLKIYCKGYNLMQENLPLLIGFLEKLTALCDENKISVTELDYEEITKLSSYAVITKKAPAKKPAVKTNKQPPNIKDTLKGVLGGCIGLLLGCSIFVVFILLSDIVGWIGGVVMSAAVISMYTVFSRKLRASDAMICAVMILFGWGFSNTFAYLFRIFLNLSEADKGVNLFGIINNLGYYATTYYEYTNLFTNSLLVSFVFVVAGAIGSYMFYYKYHPRDMY